MITKRGDSWYLIGSYERTIGVYETKANAQDALRYYKNLGGVM